MKIKYFIFGCFLSAVLNIYAQSEKITDGLPEKGDWNFNPKKLWEIEKAGDEAFGNAGEPRIGIDEMLYLRDFDKKFSYAIDGAGKLISTFSKEVSDDPGATKYVNCFTVDNKVIIGTPEKLHFYDKSGKFLKTVPGNIFVRFPFAFINEKRFFVGPGALAGLPKKADIFLVDIEKSTERRFAEISLSAEEKKLQPGGVVLGLIPQILMTYDKENNTIYFAKNSEYKIYTADESGKIISVFGRNISKNFVSDEQKIEHMNFFAGGRLTEEKIIQMGQNLPDSLTYFHRMLLNNGLIYIFRMTTLSTNSSSQEVDIFTKDGTYLYKSVIDFGDYKFENPNNIQIKDDIMYAVVVNKEGKQVVVKYKIEIPAS